MVVPEVPVVPVPISSEAEAGAVTAALARRVRPVSVVPPAATAAMVVLGVPAA